MGNEAFEQEYRDLLDKYAIPVAVLAYQEGTTLSLLGTASEGDLVSQLRCRELSNRICKAALKMKESPI